jgi:hypothetical protein
MAQHMKYILDSLMDLGKPEITIDDKNKTNLKSNITGAFKDTVTHKKEH